jgi:hypothetical protein
MRSARAARFETHELPLSPVRSDSTSSSGESDVVDRDVHILVAARGVNGSFSPGISHIDMSKLIASL